MATLIVACMSDASVAYVLGHGNIAAVEAAKSHRGAGVYELSQSFDDLRKGTYIGKTDTNMSKRINCHRASAKKKKSTLYRAIRAFKGRPYCELLLVKLPSNDPDCFLRLWRYLCPKAAARMSVEPDAQDVRATFTCLIEASFIALRRSFRLDQVYDAEANEVFGNPSGLGLNGTPGTENSVNRVRGFFGRRGYRPAVDVLRSHLLNEVTGVAGGLPRCPIRKVGLAWSWYLPGMKSRVVLEREDVEKCDLKTAKDGETGVQFKIEYEPGFQAIDRLTLEEAAELRGTKISFKVWRGDKALTDWQPLRRSKPTPPLQYLYCEAMNALCKVGAATKETFKKPALMQGKDIDLSGWAPSKVLDRARTLQSLADGRFYARGYTHTGVWETVKGDTNMQTVNVIDVKIPQKVGEWRKTNLRLGFLPFAGEHCHVWIRVTRNGIAAVSRPQDQSRDPPPAAADWVEMPSPLGPVTKQLVDTVCAYLGEEAAAVPSTRLKQLVDGTLSGVWHIMVGGQRISLSAKDMKKLGVACTPPGPDDGAQRFLWRLNVDEKVLSVARVEAPTTWVVINSSTDRRTQAIRRACDSWANP